MAVIFGTETKLVELTEEILKKGPLEGVVETYSRDGGVTMEGPCFQAEGTIYTHPLLLYYVTR